MKKTPKCKGCDEEGHYAISCRKTPRKPIKNIPRFAIGGFVKIEKPLELDNTHYMPARQRSAVSKTKPQITRKKAKERAWKAFSDYIRMRDCLLTTRTREYCVCITCNERGDISWKPYKSIQAGHAVGGRSNAILFNEEIVNGQCSFCNMKPPRGLGGDYGNYAIALIKRYGIEHVEALQHLKYTEKQYKTHDFIEIEQEYKQKLKELA